MVKWNLVFIVVIFSVLEIVTVMGMPCAPPIISEAEFRGAGENSPTFPATSRTNPNAKTINSRDWMKKYGAVPASEYPGRAYPAMSESQKTISSADAAAKYGGVLISDTPSRAPAHVKPQTLSKSTSIDYWTGKPGLLAPNKRDPENPETSEFATSSDESIKLTQNAETSPEEEKPKNTSHITEPDDIISQIDGYRNAKNDRAPPSMQDATNEPDQLLDGMQNLNSIFGAALPKKEIALNSPSPLAHPTRRAATVPSSSQNLRPVQDGPEDPNDSLNQKIMSTKMYSPQLNFSSPPPNPPSATPDEYTIPADGNAHAGRTPQAGENQFATRVRKVSSIKEDNWQPTIRTAPIKAPWVPKNLDYNLYKDGIMERTNMYRARHDASPLVYSEKLSKISQEFAESLLIDEKFGHNYDNNYGENLAQYWRPNDPYYKLPPNRPVDEWYDEIKHYSFELGGSADGEETGHFEQLVWKSSVEVGIGIAKSAEGKYKVVCTYNPGSYTGGNHENVQRAVKNLSI